MSRSFELMERTLRRTFADPLTKGLFGSGPERAIDACRSFWVDGSAPSAILECPLLGPASYDVIVGSYGSLPAKGAHLPEANPPACQAAFDWACTLDTSLGFNLFFELDANGPAGQHAGIHCRYMGDMRVAADFFQVIGEGWREPSFRAVCERLPEGWDASFVAVFAGRPGALTRIELSTTIEELRRIGSDAAHLRSCFDQLGFCAYDGAMLAQVSRIAELSRRCTLQFDISEDGMLGNTFSITSSYERTGARFGSLFEPGGAIARTCGEYERMGIADGRWRLAESVLFAKKGVERLGTQAYHATMVSMPNCGKATWRDASPVLAKLYLMQGSILGERWSLGSLV